MKRTASAKPAHAELNDETALYQRIRELVVTARQTVARGVDLVQVRTNFEIGRHIVEHEQQGEHRAAYGKAVLKALAEKLTEEFGRGFSKSNLEYMRRFFLLYQERTSIAQFGTGQLTTTPTTEYPAAVITQFDAGQSLSLSGQLRPFCLSWTHYVFLMGIENAGERSFYEIETAAQNWNLNELKRQFDSGLYERLALSRDKEGENPTIGIVLCKKKHQALVEITLPKDANIHAREYQLYLPGKEELQRKLEEWTAGVGV